MNRRDLLLADLKAKSLMRQVLQKHNDDFAPMQQQQPQEMNNASSSIRTQQSTPQPPQAPQVPPGQ